MKKCCLCHEPIPQGTKCHTSIKGFCYITVNQKIKGFLVTFLKKTNQKPKEKA